MRVREITAEGARRLKGSFAAGASLSFVVLVAYLGFQMAGMLFTSLFDTMLVRYEFSKGFSATSLLGTLVTLFLTLALISPFRLNIKGWYQGLNGGYRSLKNAFTFFTGFRRYITALWFVLVRYAAVFLTFLLPQMPSIVLAAVIKVSLERSAEALGPLYGIFLILLILLAVLALALSLYGVMGFFFADYLYIMGEERNPFRALAVSWRLMRGGRPKYIRLLLRLFPYFLLCPLLAPVPFAVPNIRSALAVYAADEIARKTPSGTSVPRGAV